MHCTLFFSSYPYSSSCQSRLRNRHVNHISRHKNSSNLISQQQMLAIHGSRKNPLPPSLKYYSILLSIMFLHKYIVLLILQQFITVVYCNEPVLMVLHQGRFFSCKRGAKSNTIIDIIIFAAVDSCIANVKCRYS